MTEHSQLTTFVHVALFDLQLRAMASLESRLVALFV